MWKYLIIKQNLYVYSLILDEQKFYVIHVNLCVYVFITKKYTYIKKKKVISIKDKRIYYTFEKNFIKCKYGNKVYVYNQIW